MQRFNTERHSRTLLVMAETRPSTPTMAARKELASLLLGTIERTTETRRLKIRSDSSRDCLADLKLSRRARRDQNKLLKSLKLFSRASVQSSSRLIPSSVRVRMVYAFKLSTGTKRRLHTKPFTKLLCRFHDANLELMYAPKQILTSSPKQSSSSHFTGSRLGSNHNDSMPRSSLANVTSVTVSPIPSSVTRRHSSRSVGSAV
ncbi:hypothetical protein Bca4012_030336 [Brassica carinata]